MAEEIIIFVYSAPEGGYEAQAADQAIFIHADSMDALKANAEDSVRCYFGEAKPLPAIRFVDAPTNVRWLGSAKGEFTVPDNFNDPLPKEIEDLFW